MREYVSLDECALLNETTKLNLQKLRWADKKCGRTDRFKDDKVLVNYQNPIFWEVHKAYFDALTINGEHPHSLAAYIAVRSGDSIASVYAYFYRMSFKQQSKARQYLKILQDFCKENDLWYALNIPANNESYKK